ncbi:MAG TPA: chemotaxis protein CheX [Bryobacteraceae bacterium]|nr:chemotaxis protein CheX [Bryobacteraceae bacterium]
MEQHSSISREDIVAAIRAATGEVFSTMLALEIAPEEVLLESALAASPKSGLVSLIGVAGSWSGTGSLACTGAFACTLASSLLACSYDSVNEEVLDAVGEITNMIIGNVKTALEEKVGEMGLSTPTVIFGRNFQTRSARVHEWTVVPFRCGEEVMYVQLCLAPNDAQRTTLRPGFQIPQILTV